MACISLGPIRRKKSHSKLKTKAQYQEVITRQGIGVIREYKTRSRENYQEYKNGTYKVYSLPRRLR